MIGLFRAEFRRVWLEFLRSPAETLVSIIVLIVLFYGFFLGADYMAAGEAGFGMRLDMIIVGYAVWTLSLHSLTSVAADLQKEAQMGAMQQVFLSSHGPVRVFISRTLADVLLNSIVTLSILIGILLLTGRRFAFSFATLAPVGAIMLGSFGVAFLMGALALWLKRVQQLINLGQFVLLFLVMAPFETWGVLAWVQAVLPMVAGAGVLRETLARGGELSASMLALAYANGVVYAIAGLVVFRMTITKVKRLGTLGWY